MLCIYAAHSLGLRHQISSKYLKKIILESVCKDFNAELVEFDGEQDHVHLLINYPPKVSIAKRVNSLKGVSSRMLRKKNYPEIIKQYIQQQTPL